MFRSIADYFPRVTGATKFAEMIGVRAACRNQKNPDVVVCFRGSNWQPRRAPLAISILIKVVNSFSVRCERRVTTFSLIANRASRTRRMADSNGIFASFAV